MTQFSFYQYFSTFVLLGTVVFTTGCSTVRTVSVASDINRTDDEWRETLYGLEKCAKDNEAKVQFAGGESIDKATLRIRPDSLCWEKRIVWSEIDSWANARTYNAAPWSEIASITFVDKGKGVREGFGIGLLVGGLLGAMMGSSGDDYWYPSGAAGAAIGAGVFGLFGV